MLALKNEWPTYLTYVLTKISRAQMPLVNLNWSNALKLFLQKIIWSSVCLSCNATLAVTSAVGDYHKHSSWKVMFVSVLQYEILITFKDLHKLWCLDNHSVKTKNLKLVNSHSPKITRKANFSIGVNGTNTNHSNIRENTFMMLRSSPKNLFLALK